MHSHTNLHGAIVFIVEKKKRNEKREKNGRLTKALSDMENYEDIFPLIIQMKQCMHLKSRRAFNGM